MAIALDALTSVHHNHFGIDVIDHLGIYNCLFGITIHYIT